MESSARDSSGCGSSPESSACRWRCWERCQSCAQLITRRYSQLVKAAWKRNCARLAASLMQACCAMSSALAAVAAPFPREAVDGVVMADPPARRRRWRCHPAPALSVPLFWGRPWALSWPVTPMTPELEKSLAIDYVTGVPVRSPGRYPGDALPPSVQSAPGRSLRRSAAPPRGRARTASASECCGWNSVAARSGAASVSTFASRT